MLRWMIILNDRIKYENIRVKLELCKWNVYTKKSVETTVQQVFGPFKLKNFDWNCYALKMWL